MSTETFEKYTAVRCRALFYDAPENGSLADPTTVIFIMKDPNGNLTTYTYPADAEIVKAATGNYYTDVIPTVAGLYLTWFRGTGAIVIADNDSFLVVDNEPK